MVANLSPEESARLEEFLRRPRIGVLATVNRSGSPQISPIWYRYAGGKVTISTTRQTLKYHNLKRDVSRTLRWAKRRIWANWGKAASRARRKA